MSDIQAIKQLGGQKPGGFLPFNRNSPLLRNAVAWWPFLYSAGSSAIDLIGKNSGSFEGEPSWVHADTGSGVLFDGNNDYIDVGNGSDLNPAAASVFARVKFLSFPETSNPVFGKVSDGSHYLLLSVENSGKLQAFLANGSSKSITSTLTLSLNKWYTIGITYSISTGLKGYIDGKLVASTGGGISLGGNNLVSARIANQSNTAQFSNVLIQNMLFFNDAIPVEQVRLISDNPWEPFESTVLYPIGALASPPATPPTSDPTVVSIYTDPFYNKQITELIANRNLKLHTLANNILVYEGKPYSNLVIVTELQTSDTSAVGFPKSKLGRFSGPHSLVLDLTSAGDSVYSVHMGYSVDEDLTTDKTKMLYFNGATAKTTLSSSDGHAQLLNPVSEYKASIKPDVLRNAFYYLEVASAGVTSGEILWEFFSS